MDGNVAGVVVVLAVVLSVPTVASAQSAPHDTEADLGVGLAEADVQDSENASEADESPRAGHPEEDTETTDASPVDEHQEGSDPAGVPPRQMQIGWGALASLGLFWGGMFMAMSDMTLFRDRRHPRETLGLELAFGGPPVVGGLVVSGVAAAYDHPSNLAGSLLGGLLAAMASGAVIGVVSGAVRSRNRGVVVRGGISDTDVVGQHHWLSGPVQLRSPQGRR